MYHFLKKKRLQIKFYLVVFLSLLICLVNYAVPATRIDEYEMKAIYLYNFAKFITWPNAAFSNTEAPFQLCLMGVDPFDGQLEATIKDGTVKERKLEVRYLTDIQELKGCHILFISRSERPQLTKILVSVKQSATLTVSEIDDFVTRGGMIQLYMLDNKVRFSIDPQTLSEAGLKASSSLLQLAKIIRRP